MAYSQQVIDAVQSAPKTLGNQLGRWAVYLDFPVTRQTIYNWFGGGEVFVAYRPTVTSLVQILQSSGTAEEAWSKACKAFDHNS
jgi:hypothetical protein